MSIINQMLKDLENRSEKQSGSKVNSDPVFSHGALRKRKIWRRFLWLSLLALVLLLVDLFVIIHHIDRQSFERQSVPVLTPVIPTSAPAVLTTPNAEAMLTGVTVDVSNGVTRLRFLLRRSVFYRISADAAGLTYLITLEHTQMTAGLPAINYAGTAIDALKVTGLPDGSLQILLQLKKGARLQQAGIFSGMSPEFQIDLFYLPPIETPQAVAKLPPPVISRSVGQDSFAAQSLSKATQLLAAGEVDKSIALLKSVVGISPGFHPARETLVRVLMEHGRMEEAGEVLRSGRLRYPDWLPYIDLQARWLAKRGQTSAALALMGRYTPPLALHLDYYALMAALYQRENQPLIAARLYQQLLGLQPHNATWWLGIAIALDASSRHAEAISAYNRAEQEEGTGLSPALKAWIDTRLHPIE